MNTALLKLNEMAGIYEGTGINHEGQAFAGRLSIQSLLAGRGVQIKFIATGEDGTVYHQEESTIAPSIQEKLTLWNFNTNSPGLIPHELQNTSTKPGAQLSMAFAFNLPSDKNAFREQVALDIWDCRTVSYTYSWGLPGGEFAERSGARMVKQPVDTTRVEFLSAVLLISKEPKVLADFYRNVIGIPLEDEVHGGSELHYGCELGDLHFAIHPVDNFKGTGHSAGSVKLAFTVFDMNSFVKKVEGHGIKLAYPPKDTGFAIMTALTDPDGNYIEFTQLADHWFAHLIDRKDQGIEVIQRWKQSNNLKISRT